MFVLELLKADAEDVINQWKQRNVDLTDFRITCTNDVVTIDCIHNPRAFSYTQTEDILEPIDDIQIHKECPYVLTTSTMRQVGEYLLNGIFVRRKSTEPFDWYRQAETHRLNLLLKATG